MHSLRRKMFSLFMRTTIYRHPNITRNRQSKYWQMVLAMAAALLLLASTEARANFIWHSGKDFLEGCDPLNMPKNEPTRSLICLAYVRGIVDGSESLLSFYAQPSENTKDPRPERLWCTPITKEGSVTREGGLDYIKMYLALIDFLKNKSDTQNLPVSVVAFFVFQKEFPCKK